MPDSVECDKTGGSNKFNSGRTVLQVDNGKYGLAIEKINAAFAGETVLKGVMARNIKFIRRKLRLLAYSRKE